MHGIWKGAILKFAIHLATQVTTLFFSLSPNYFPSLICFWNRQFTPSFWGKKEKSSLNGQYSLVPIRRHVPINSHASRHGTCNGPYRSHISMPQKVWGWMQGMLYIFVRHNPIISHTSKMCWHMKCTAPNKDHASRKWMSTTKLRKIYSFADLARLIFPLHIDPINSHVWDFDSACSK